MKSTDHIHDAPATSLVRAMCVYINSGTSDDDRILRAEIIVGKTEVLVFCANMISWLKSRKKFGKMKSIKSHHLGLSERERSSIVSEETGFSSIFSIDGDEVNFRKEVTCADVESAILIADELYNPPRFVTKRPRN